MDFWAQVWHTVWVGFGWVALTAAVAAGVWFMPENWRSYLWTGTKWAFWIALALLALFIVTVFTGLIICGGFCSLG